jgi:hypothetical protein
MRRWWRRLWCRFWHGIIAYKTEHVSKFTWSQRCLECGEVFLYEKRGGRKWIP